MKTVAQHDRSAAKPAERNRRRPWPRRQPPVHSPIRLSAVAGAVAPAIRLARDPRPDLADVLGRDFAAEAAILCGSGTQALHLGLLAARAHVGSNAVALPAFTCYDVASAAVGAGARILLYDVDPVTLGPDQDSLLRTLRDGARTVVVAPLYGMPVDWSGVESMAHQHGAEVVEDAAQGHGSAWRGRAVGGLGALSILSFGRGKGWTGGSGGALLLRGSAELAGTSGDTPGAVARLAAPWVGRELALLAAAMAQAAIARPGIYALPAAIPWLGLGETRYRQPRPLAGMTRAAAALVQRSREYARAEARVRRTHGAWLAEALRAVRGAFAVSPVPGAEPGYLRFPVRLRGGLGAFADVDDARRLGIAASYPLPLAALEPVRTRLAGPIPECPGAEELARTLITLPTHSGLTAGEMNEIVEALQGERP